MQFSDIIPQAHHFRFSFDCSFFAYIESKRIYIKECSVDLKNIAIINLPQSPSQIIISSDSKLIAALIIPKSIVMVYRIDGTQISRIEDSQSGISGIMWAPDSLQILVYSDFMYKFSAYNLSTKMISSIRGPKIPNEKGCCFTSDGKFMALLQKHDCKDYVSFYFTVDWKLVNSSYLDLFDAVQISWTPNNSYLVVWDNCINYKFIVVCPMKGIIFKYQPYDYALGIKNVQFSNDSKIVAIGSFDEKIRLLNTLTWKFICQLDCSNPIINSNQTKVYKQDDSQKIVNHMRLIQSTNYKIPSVKIVYNDKTTPNQGIGLLGFSYDDSYIACRNDNMPYTVWILCTQTLQLQTVICLNTMIKMIKWSSQYNTLCIVFGTDRLLYWKNGIIMQCEFPFQNRKFNIHKIIWSQDARKMLMSDKNDLVYADLVDIDDN